ncbi:Uncharacterized conserved protein [Phaffia rhodozyma]|uniref:Type 1 phosphatases regulator n=1 Tax=Phaffia rhodozyma TaxID=264483 RepID=A0A0F7SNH2_PHARH|nr:Uncharacterized conserved protein [Phaffia rhodozyma]
MSTQQPSSMTQTGGQTLVDNSSIDLPSIPSTEVGTLRLRGNHSEKAVKKVMKGKVSWVEGTVDNEHLNRKKSKMCCIYHKPRPFDESSSDESSSCPSSGESDHGIPSAIKKKKTKRPHHHQPGECPDHHGSAGSSELNKLDGGGRKA